MRLLRKQLNLSEQENLRLRQELNQLKETTKEAINTAADVIEKSCKSLIALTQHQ